MSLTFGSLFDGISCFTLGLSRAGMTPRWVVELEDDCRRVSANHFPDVKQYADVRECGKKNLAKVDVIVGGFPCQDLSVAGKRGGIGGERSGLFFEMLRIVDELRPRYLLWENVFGLLSSFSPRNAAPDPDGVGRKKWVLEEDSDFTTVLSALADVGYFGACRVLDGQWFGVPQRRRRVFGLFAGVSPRNRKRLDSEASGEDGRRLARVCAEILLVGYGRDGNPPTRGTQGEDVAATIRSRSAKPGVNPPGRGGEDDSNLIAGTLGGGSGKRGWCDDLDRAGAFVTEEARRSAVNGGASGLERDNATCLTSRTGSRQDFDTECFVVGSLQAHSKEHGHAMGTQQAAESGHLVAFQCHGNNVGPMGTIRQGNGGLTGGVPFVAEPTTIGFTLSSDPNNWMHDAVPPMTRRHGDGGNVAQGMVVRRLTPTECLRLQGLPDDWLDIDPPLSDSAKYRMIGNGGVTFVVQWIGRRILEHMKGTSCHDTTTPTGTR